MPSARAWVSLLHVPWELPKSHFARVCVWTGKQASGNAAAAACCSLTVVCRLPRRLWRHQASVLDFELPPNGWKSCWTVLVWFLFC